jgi:hypothetical protein
MIKRQMYGRAGFTLLRHRILLGLSHIRSPPKVRQSQNNSATPRAGRTCEPCEEGTP